MQIVLLGVDRPGIEKWPGGAGGDPGDRDPERYQRDDHTG